MTPLVSSIGVALLLAVTAAAHSYSELLELAPLARSSLFASFAFHSEAPLVSFEQQNFRYLPRALSQILQYSHTKELHLRFGSGRWDEDLWGPLPRNGSRTGGTGVELWAWVEADNDDDAETRWLTLTNTLSGLFCASLNFIDSTRTIRPVEIFPPEGSVEGGAPNLRLLHGQLARETVCTENLTPFLKFIPCKGKSGISSLFDGHKLFDSQWQSMSVDVRTVCAADGSDCSVQLDQMVDMVLDIERSKRPRDDPIPRPVEQEMLPCDPVKYYNAFGDACYPMRNEHVPGFTLSELFGRTLKGSCPLTTANGADAPSTLCFDISANPSLQVNTQGSYKEELKNDGKQRCFKMAVGTDFDINMGELNITSLPPATSVPIHVERALSGLGQEHGGSRTVFTNPSPDHAVSLVYLESLPWFMKPYIHTLQASVASTAEGSSPPEDDLPFSPADYLPLWMRDTNDPATFEARRVAPPPQDASTLISNLHYLPAIDRRRGTHLELELTVPPASTLTLTYDFDKALLRYTEYPPDPNRGFDVPPAVLRILPSAGAEGPAPSEYFLRTNSLLIYLPTPDFSMPYNVIILTSTVIALAFGSLFNIIVRRFVGAEEVDGVGGGLLSVLVQRLIARVRQRLSKEQTDKKNQ